MSKNEQAMQAPAWARDRIELLELEVRSLKQRLATGAAYVHRMKEATDTVVAYLEPWGETIEPDATTQPHAFVARKGVLRGIENLCSVCDNTRAHKAHQQPVAVERGKAIAVGKLSVGDRFVWNDHYEEVAEIVYDTAGVTVVIKSGMNRKFNDDDTLSLAPPESR